MPARRTAPRRLAHLVLAALALSAAAPAAHAAAPAVQELKVPSKALGGERVLLVRLPASYGKGAQRYPVLWFTDGDRLMPAIAGMAELLAGAGAIPELILVGVRQVDRTNELTPTAGWLPRAGGGRQEVARSGGADRLLAFLEQEAIPLVEASYRTEPCRLLAGHSFGGLFAMYTLGARPGLFRARLAMAPSFGWDGDYLVRTTRALLAAGKAPAGALVVTLGDEGKVGAAGLEELTRVLAGAPPSLRARTIHLPGEDHGSVVVPSLYEGLRAIFAGWRMKVPEDADVGPRGGLTAVEAHFRALSERFGYQVPIPEREVNLAGYQALQDGQPEEAIRAFQRNKALHPDSPNVHDSLGEALERSGDAKGAAASFRRAWELAEAQQDPLLEVYKKNALRASAAAAR